MLRGPLRRRQIELSGFAGGKRVNPVQKALRIGAAYEAAACLFGTSYPVTAS